MLRFLEFKKDILLDERSQILKGFDSLHFGDKLIEMGHFFKARDSFLKKPLPRKVSSKVASQSSGHEGCNLFEKPSEGLWTSLGCMLTSKKN